ncbi:MAG: hydroxyacid dehydrogenase [Gemmatimonadetes bacterium]|nr:MAG: hydroxyacid dehydrogenase [Gemmatimonadota bacterium]
MKILISDKFDPSLPQRLEPYGDVTEDKSRLPEADIVLVRSATKCTKEYIDQAKNLKLIIRGGVGLDNIDLAYAKEKNIIVKNTASASSVAVAELAFALMLSIPTRLIEAHESMKAGKWEKKNLKRTELYTKTLCLIGTGNIGSEVAKRAYAFGMKVIGYAKDTPKVREIIMFEKLEEAVKNADYISLHVPAVPETIGMINKETIAMMKDGVAIINTARGEVVNEADMAEALKSGKVHAYATDVWLSDPPAKDSPLLSAPNVIMTPHIGANSKENLLRISDIVVNMVRDYIEMVKHIQF